MEIEIKKYLKTKRKIETETRHLNDMRRVLYDRPWAKKAKNFGVYHMFRGVKKNRGIRYDITAILPKMLGREFPKTKGHFHPGNVFEIYKILDGNSIFLFQKMVKNAIKDVFAVKAKRGEFVSIPPGYEHIKINPSKKRLILANWIPETAKSDYSHLEKKEGACYYYTRKGWIRNKNYKKIPELRFESPLRKKPGSLKF